MDRYSWVMRTWGVFLGVAVVITGPAVAYSGGEGTETEPYQIGTADDWLMLMTTTSDWNKHFVLVADIDFAGASLTPVGRGEMTGTPPRLTGNAFTGVFDGAGHVVRNATLSLPENDCVGLFGWCASDGEVRNLSAHNITVSGSRYVGVIVGRGKTLSNCHAQGSVTGSSYVGLLAGYLFSHRLAPAEITECSASGSVTATPTTGVGIAGGLVGENSEGVISDSFFTGTVLGRSAGGLVGYNRSGTIQSSFAAGSVTGTYGAGGLTSYNDQGLIIASYSTSSVNAALISGGLVASNNRGPANRGINIIACYAAGPVTGTGALGGLAVESDTFWGGNFWDTEATGQPASAVGLGLTTSQMRVCDSFGAANWGSYGWVMEAGSLPRLEWEGLGWPPVPPTLPALDGSGTEQDPLLIYTVDDFLQLYTNYYGLAKYFRLMNDLDLEGTTLIPIGELDPFTGVFDGNNHTLFNADIAVSGTDGCGLFNNVGSEGRIENLNLVNVSVTGVNNVGGLAALNQGTITNVHISGTVRGDNTVGGLVGSNWGGTIEGCHSDAQVSGAWYVGGLAGMNTHHYANFFDDLRSSTIANSSASGPVVGTVKQAGGLSGHNSLDCLIISSHASGSVSGLDEVGGGIGYNDGRVEACNASGSVSGREYTGGLVGRLHTTGVIINSFATADVNGVDYVGGLVGVTWFTAADTTLHKIEGCYASGAVSGNTYVGGLAGLGGRLIASYAAGPVTGVSYVGGLAGSLVLVEACYATGAVTGSENVGGLTGYAEHLGWNSFWDIQTTGMEHSAAGKALETARMKDAAVFSAADWHAYGWFMTPGDYPRRAWEEPGGTPVPAPPPLSFQGSGTDSDPYKIFTAAEFLYLSWHVDTLDKHYRLMRDIDLAGCVFYPIGDAPKWLEHGVEVARAFTGVFDGRSHALKNATTTIGNAEDRTGGNYFNRSLFCVLGESAVIRNLVVEDIVVEPERKGWHVGGLAAVSYGHIHACRVTGRIVTDGQETGAIVGTNYGRITTCNVDVDVLGNIASQYGTLCGGITGLNFGEIRNSYAVGSVTGTAAGGLAGGNNGQIISCYSNVAVHGLECGGLVNGNTGTIESSYSLGDVTCLDVYGALGAGLVASNRSSGTIEACFSVSAVTGGGHLGGLVGHSSGTILNSYARGAITGTSYAIMGGLVAEPVDVSGSVDPLITNSCYSTGRISASYSSPPSVRGGLIGKVPYPLSTIEKSYWDTQTSQVGFSAGGAGRSTAAMTYPYAENTYEAWDFVDVWAADVTGEKNDGYPWLPSAVFTPLPTVSITGRAYVGEGNQILLQVTLPDAKGEYTIDWYKDGELICSGCGETFTILHATAQHAGMYYAILTDASQTSLRTPPFQVRVALEGLPLLNGFGLIILTAILVLGVIRCLRNRSRLTGGHSGVI